LLGLLDDGLAAACAEGGECAERCRRDEVNPACKGYAQWASHRRKPTDPRRAGKPPSPARDGRNERDDVALRQGLVGVREGFVSSDAYVAPALGKGEMPPGEMVGEGSDAANFRREKHCLLSDTDRVAQSGKIEDTYTQGRLAGTVSSGWRNHGRARGILSLLCARSD
jgi:hypothetical protein